MAENLDFQIQFVLKRRSTEVIFCFKITFFNVRRRRAIRPPPEEDETLVKKPYQQLSTSIHPPTYFSTRLPTMIEHETVLVDGSAATSRSLTSDDVLISEPTNNVNPSAEDSVVINPSLSYFLCYQHQEFYKIYSTYLILFLYHAK